jgi:hypothetical protein
MTNATTRVLKTRLDKSFKALSDRVVNIAQTLTTFAVRVIDIGKDFLQN